MRKDMMQAFELFQPDNLDAALSLADRYGDEAVSYTHLTLPTKA